MQQQRKILDHMESSAEEKAEAGGSAPRPGFSDKTVPHVILIAVVGLIVYFNTFRVPFHFDDGHNIVNNPVIKDLAGFLSGAGYGFSPRRFIGYLTIALNYRLGGLDVTGYHIFNLAIHIISACLVYVLVRLTFRTPFFAGARNEERGTSISGFSNLEPRTSNLVPLLAALLFIAHPIQTQAVTYIIQRLASLATMFYLLSLVLYIKSRLSADSPTEQPEIRNPKLETPFLPSSRKTVTLLYYLGSLLAAVLAMKTKEIAFTLPLVTALYEMCFFRGKAGRRLLVLLPMLLTLAIVPLSLMEGGRPAGELLSDLSEKAKADMMVPRWDYFITQFRVIVTYLRLLILPVNQNLDYDYPIYHTFFTPPVLLSFLFLLSLIALAGFLFCKSRCGVRNGECGMQAPGTQESVKIYQSLVTSHQSRLVAFGIFWFFITLSVESSIIPIADVIFEHRLYLPSVGAFIAIATAGMVIALKIPAKASAVVALAAILALSATAWKRNLVWGDPGLLWQDTVSKSPAKVRPRYNFGNELSRKGFKDRAIEQYQIALSINPEYADARNNMGVVFLEKGDIDKAIRHFEVALGSKPDLADAYYNLGDAFSAKGDTDKAIENYQTALKIQPDYSEAHNNLGIVYAKMGSMEKALERFKAAVRFNPDNRSARNNLTRALNMSGK